MMTKEEFNNAAKALESGEAIEIEGTRLVAEGVEWCVTHPNKAFDSFPRYGCLANGITAKDLLKWLDLLNNMACSSL